MDKKEVRLNAEKRRSLVIDFRKHCESIDTHEKEAFLQSREDAKSIKERKNLSSNGFMEVTIMITPKGNIHNKPILTFKGLPINETDEFVYGLEEEIDKATRTFSLNNKKQESNLIDSLKTICKKYSKEKTGKKPITNVNLVRI